MLLKMVFIRKSSSLTIWKADKTIFKIVCKVLNVCLYDKHQYNTFKCSWVLRKQNKFESGKIESASCIKIADNFGDLTSTRNSFGLYG
ncbi:hypothetical protein BWP24_02195 [Vibrio campbellii]|nr:hypothetical protein BWP24_02195 [Vibrio campbellii]